MKPLLAVLIVACAIVIGRAQTNLSTGATNTAVPISLVSNAPAPVSVSNAAPPPVSKSDTSPTGVQIWGLILGAIGTIGTVIKLIEFYHDRARLSIRVSLSIVSNEVSPIQHFSLEVIFVNRGRRPITMIEGLIKLPPGGKMIMGDGREIPVSSAAKPLFNAGVQVGLTIESHKRRVLIFEPFDASLLRNSRETATAVFTDAIGNEYDVDFLVPPAEDIDRIMANFPVIKQQQKNQKLGAQTG